MSASRSHFGTVNVEPAPRPWSIEKLTHGERDDWTFADGTPVCVIKDANGGMVAYDVGYPEARLILTAVEVYDDRPEG